jgi:hypothetical protein
MKKADIMDEQPASYIRHRLVRFRETIGATKEHYHELSPFGRHYAGAPYYEKSGILVLLDEIRSDPGTREELCTEFRQVLRELEILEQELGREYRAQLRQDLHYYTDTYAAMVCHEHLGSVRFETDHDLFRRDLITVLLHELERDHDLTDIKALIHSLDNSLFIRKRAAEQGTISIAQQTAGINQPSSDRSRIEN